MVSRRSPACRRGPRLRSWLALWALAVAFVGFMWDVAWHADLGRDSLLFTVPHTMMVTGLIFLVIAGFTGAFYATITGAQVGWMLGRIRVPYTSVVLILLGGTAALAFPLDDWWHLTYGLDVSMWSPPHVMMLGTTAVTPIVLTMGLAEAKANRKHPMVRLLSGIFAAAILVGINAFMLEFDIGVPQWQILFQPLLIAVAAGLSLVAARQYLGRGGAIRVVVSFIVIRLAVNLIDTGLGHVTAHFPLYIAEAVAVEVVFWQGTRRSGVAQALVAGALIGSVGIAAEWLWMQAWGLQPWQPRMLPSMWVPLVAAMAAAILGLGLGEVIRGRTLTVSGWSMAAAVGVIMAMVAVPLIRQPSPATVHIATTQVGASRIVLDRYGLKTVGKDVLVSVDITPANTANGADWFEIIDWQGGRVIQAPLVSTGGGHYHTTKAVPTGGSGKAAVYLANGPVLGGAFVSAPLDPESALPMIPVEAERTTTLIPIGSVLVREAHGGVPLPAIVIDVATVISVALTLAALFLAGARIASGRTTTLTLPTRRRRKAFAGA